MLVRIRRFREYLRIAGVGEGTGISIDSVRKVLEELGAVIHSIDDVSVAKKTRIESEENVSPKLTPPSGSVTAQPCSLWLTYPFPSLSDVPL